MNHPHFKKSPITGREYDLFEVVRILNIPQVIFYLQNNVPLEDIIISEDRRRGTPVLVYLFSRRLSKDAYDRWCKERDKENENNGN